MKLIRDISDEDVFGFFGKHVGQKRAASLSDVSRGLFNHKLNEFDQMEVAGMFGLASRLVEKYRTSKKLFIIKKSGWFYIPDSDDDIDYFEGMTKRITEGMRKSVKYLKEFVGQKQYERLYLRH